MALLNHFRQADLEAKAMSPMFLGGLTVCN